MKVRMLTAVSGPDYAAQVGDEIEVDDDYAKRMMESDPPQCIPVEAAPVKESRSK